MPVPGTVAEALAQESDRRAASTASAVRLLPSRAAAVSVPPLSERCRLTNRRKASSRRLRSRLSFDAMAALISGEAFASSAVVSGRPEVTA